MKHSLGVVQGDVTNGQILTHMWSKGYDSVDTVASWVLLLWLAFVQQNCYAVVHGAGAEQPRHVNLKKGTASQGVLNKRWVMTVMYACS